MKQRKTENEKQNIGLTTAKKEVLR